MGSDLSRPNHNTETIIGILENPTILGTSNETAMKNSLIRHQSPKEYNR